VNLLEQFGVALVPGQGLVAVALEDDALHLFGAHDRPGPEPAEMAVGVHVDAGIGAAVFPGRADAQNGAVARGAGGDLAQQLARGEHISAPQVVDVEQLDAPASDHEHRRPRGPARDHQGVVAREAQGESRTAAGMGFCVIFVIRGFEPAHGLAHEREIARGRTDGENERLVRIKGRRGGLAVFFVQQGRQARTADHLPPAGQFHQLADRKSVV
jgi:hypothetical protein